MSDILLASVLRSRRWVNICINLLLDITGLREAVLREFFAVYYLEALLLKKDSPTEIFERLIQKIIKSGVIDSRRVRYVLEKEALELLGLTSLPTSAPEEKKYAVVLGQHIFYRRNEQAQLEDVLRESLMKHAWQRDWASCPGYPIFALKSDCLRCHSIFEKVNYKTLATQELISTVLPESTAVAEKIFAVLEELVTKKPKQKIILFSTSDVMQKTGGKKYTRCSLAGYCWYLGMTDAEAVAALRGKLPAIPSRTLDFDAMFARLAQPLPLGVNSFYRTFNHTRDGVRVAIELELGLVNRTYPEDYVEADSISDFFSYEQRMECNKTKRSAGGRVAQPSPIMFWKRNVLTLESILEDNAIQTEEDMAEYLYAKTSACGIFNAGFAAHIYRRFGGRGCRVLDAFAGWGERMVAAVAVGCSEYQGYDTNERIPYTAIKERLTASGAKLDVEITPFELANPKRNYFDITVASPPFFNYEIYIGGQTSTTLYQQLTEWNEDFWKPSLRNMLAAIRPGGHIFLYIPTGGDDVADVMNRSVTEVYADEATYVGKIGYAQQVVNSPKLIRTAICYRKN